MAQNSALREADGVRPEDGVNPNHPAAAKVTVVDADAGIVEPSDRKRIAICGFASSSRDQIPVGDATWEIWGLNQLYRHIARADRWFDIHKNWFEETVPGTDYVGWIKQCGIPFYMADRVEGLPTSVRFPVERLIEKFGADYFTSTVAFMVALAIDEIDQKVGLEIEAGALAGVGVDSREAIRALYSQYCIGLYGIDLVVGEEYDWQKACAEFWLGAAAVGRGIKVHLPPQSALCKQLYRYGYEKDPGGRVNSNEIREHAKKVAADRDHLMRQMYMHDGALQTDEYWIQLLTLRERGADVKG